MVVFCCHGKGIFKTGHLLDQKADFDDRYGKMILRYSFLWENFENSILGTFWPNYIWWRKSNGILAKSTFNETSPKSTLGAQKNRFFSKLRQFQHNPQNALESAWKARFGDIWVLGSISSRFVTTVDFLKFYSLKNVDFPQTDLRFPRELFIRLAKF